jgi:hypothetical protein
MKSRMWLMAVAMTLGAPASASEVAAQAIKVKPGDTLWRTDASDRISTGVVQEVAPSVLVVRVAGTDERWLLDEIHELWRAGDSPRNGLVIGALAGGAAGLTAALALGSLYEDVSFTSGGSLMAWSALGALAGLGVGAGIDSIFRGRTLVYRRPTKSLTFRPAFTATRRGAQVTLRF